MQVLAEMISAKSWNLAPMQIFTECCWQNNEKADKCGEPSEHLSNFCTFHNAMIRARIIEERKVF